VCEIHFDGFQIIGDTSFPYTQTFQSLCLVYGKRLTDSSLHDSHVCTSEPFNTPVYFSEKNWKR